jgi:hypothetical protein
MAVKGVDYIDAEDVVGVNENPFDEDLLEHETFYFSFMRGRVLIPCFGPDIPQRQMTPEQKAAYDRGFNYV